MLFRRLEVIFVGVELISKMAPSESIAAAEVEPPKRETGLWPLVFRITGFDSFI